MARAKQNFEKGAIELIKHLTDFKEDEENFGLCLEFVLSNFRFHRFLDVDSHKIHRTLEGLQQKLNIHSQEEKARFFKESTENFLNAPVFERKDHGKTDTHYGILSLLLNLADSQTSVKFKEKEEQLAEKEKPFDWYAYLTEGDEVYRPYYGDSPDYSDEEDDLGPHADDSGVVVGEGKHVTFETQEQDTLQPDHGNDWLSRNIIVQYWRGDLDGSLTLNTHWCNKLAENWASYLSSSNPVYVPPSTMTVSEEHVVRELIWMMSGVANASLFELVDKQYRIKKTVQVLHLTQGALAEGLKNLSKYSYISLILQTFIDDVMSFNCYGDNTECSSTYQAFASSLVTSLHPFRLELLDIEKIIIKREESFTLMKLQEKLKHHFPLLDTLYYLYTNGIECVPKSMCNSQKAARILSTIYDAILQSDMLANNNTNRVSTLLCIWAQTCRPYIEILDDWITNGSLIDLKQEFIIHRNTGKSTLDETFWETAFTIDCTSDTEYSKERNSQSKSQSSTEQSKSDDASSEQTRMNEHAISERLQGVPKFLLPVLEKVILAGKSMQVLENLGRLNDVIGRTEHTQKSLYDSLIESLQDELGSTSDNENPQPPDSHTVTAPTDCSDSQDINKQLYVKGIHNPFLKLNFENMESKKKIQSLTIKEDETLGKLKKLNLDCMCPVQLAVQSSLHPHIEHKYLHVCKSLLDILVQEFHLMDYLASMRHFYLMEASDTMYDFYIDIFDKLRLHEDWKDVSYLNLVLHDALQQHHPEEASRLSLFIDETKGAKDIKGPVNALDSLALLYKVPWPVNVVISSKCQDYYNQIFTFLLQIKRAKYSLDELRFIDLKGQDGGQRSEHLIHRMHLFRMKLLHFVNSLHNYIVTRILQNTGLEFQEDIQQAPDLDQVIKLHNTYIANIYDRCLLHQRVAFIKEAVLKVLNLVFAFQANWDSGINSVNEEILSEMELDFSRCIQFLTSFLNNVIKRGSFQHLESLAFALLSSNETITMV
ncbi:unnamed protein product [Owenia fusiformis]|uniref:Gamma-tubulin complex component n=1 Tax=Owenia fusiformis TaxID=6347 RepID=A0A8J1UE06_OWEFU|nr:unnamed protein product [Owenia fusiformis]